LVVSPDGNVKLVPVEGAGPGSALEKIIDAIPTIIDTVEDLIERFK
jgi:uncharacterized spore protein YtfJ